MKLILLTQYYPPETGAPQNRLADLAARFVAMGHEVTVLTAMPNYPVGQVYPGYRWRVFAREHVNGIPVVRSWILATRNRSLLPRLITSLTFVVSSTIAGAFALSRADVLLTESPPLFLGMSGCVLARLKRARFVMNVADLWIQAAVEMNVVKSRRLVRAATWLEAGLYRSAAAVTAQTQGIKAAVERLAPEKSAYLFTNGVATDVFRPDVARPDLIRDLGLEGRFIVGYAGIHGLAQALHTVVDAGEHLKSVPEIVITFFGDGPLKEELQARAAARGLTNVRFFPVQPKEAMPGLTAAWSAGLVPLVASAIGRSALPSKMFEIMAAEVPVLVSAPAGEATALVDAAAGGLVVEPEDAERLAAAILQLHRDPALRRSLGQNARRYVEQHFNRATIAANLASYLTGIVTTGRAPQPVRARVTGA